MSFDRNSHIDADKLELDPRLAALDAQLFQRAATASVLPGLAEAVEARVNYRLEAERWMKRNRGSMYRRVRRSAATKARGPLLIALARALMTRSAAQFGASVLGALLGYFTLIEVVIPSLGSMQFTAEATSTLWGSLQVTPIGLAAAGSALCALAALAFTQLNTLRREYF
jgi:hypothetical protein